MKKILSLILILSTFGTYSFAQKGIHGCIAVSNNNMKIKMHKGQSSALCNNENITSFIWGSDGPSRKAYYVAVIRPGLKIDWPRVLNTGRHKGKPVMTYPYFAKVSSKGAFQFENIPDGTYEVEAWHQKAGLKSLRITIKDGRIK